MGISILWQSQKVIKEFLEVPFTPQFRKIACYVIACCLLVNPLSDTEKIPFISGWQSQQLGYPPRQVFSKAP